MGVIQISYLLNLKFIFIRGLVRFIQLILTVASACGLK